MTKKVYCGKVEIGGGAPVSIQSMLNVSSKDEKAVLRQTDELVDAGCEIVRIAVPDMESVSVLESVRKKRPDVPFVADIHFDYRLAIAAMDIGFDKIRINPGNIGSREKLEAVISKAKERNIPIRVGVNGGSLEKDIVEKNGGVTPEGLAESAIRNIKIIEDMDYDNLVISLKSSDVKMNFDAHRIVSEMTDHPLHIGITESGTEKHGKLKSAIGLGSLLLDGIGDTMRVSLTADPVKEVLFAKRILETVGMRKPKYTLVSCPTCGRTQVDLKNLAEETDSRLEEEKIEGISVAVMGCVVNGPGEAKEADYGIAGGKGKGIIFKKGEVVETATESELVGKLIDLIKKDRKG